MIHAGLRPDVPMTISVSVVIASEVLLPGRSICLDFERLIDAPKEIICIVWTDIHQGRNVLFYLRRGEPTHEVEHGV